MLSNSWTIGTKSARVVALCAAFLASVSGTGGYEDPTGFVEICGAPDALAPTTRMFRATLSGHSNEFIFPGDACTAPIRVRAGEVRVTEVPEEDVEVTKIEAFSIDEIGSRVSREVAKSLGARTAYVNVPAGGVSTQTVIVFTNKRTK